MLGLVWFGFDWYGLLAASILVAFRFDLVCVGFGRVWFGFDFVSCRFLFD